MPSGPPTKVPLVLFAGTAIQHRPDVPFIDVPLIGNKVVFPSMVPLRLPGRVASPGRVPLRLIVMLPIGAIGGGGQGMVRFETVELDEVGSIRLVGAVVFVSGRVALRDGRAGGAPAEAELIIAAGRAIIPALS